MTFDQIIGALLLLAIGGGAFWMMFANWGSALYGDSTVESWGRDPRSGT